MCGDTWVFFPLHMLIQNRNVNQVCTFKESEPSPDGGVMIGLGAAMASESLKKKFHRYHQGPSLRKSNKMHSLSCWDWLHNFWYKVKTQSPFKDSSEFKMAIGEHQTKSLWAQFKNWHFEWLGGKSPFSVVFSPSPDSHKWLVSGESYCLFKWPALPWKHPHFVKINTRLSWGADVWRHLGFFPFRRSSKIEMLCKPMEQYFT